MGIASDIKMLGEDIVASYDARVKAIGGLVKDTHNMLKGFQTEHKEMAEKLSADLANGEGDRLKTFKQMMTAIQKGIEELARSTHSLLKGFQGEHKEMSDKLRADLAKGEKDRLAAFKPMMDNIKKFVADMVDTTDKLMKQIQEEQKDRNKAVADLLGKFNKDHAAMADELKKSLAKGETDRIEDFEKMMNAVQKYVADVFKETKRLIKEIQARQGERNKEVLDLLETFKNEREEMAKNWQTLTEIMAKKRGSEPVKGEAAVKVIKVKTVKEVVEKPKNKGKKKAVNKKSEGRKKK